MRLVGQLAPAGDAIEHHVLCRHGEGSRLWSPNTLLQAGRERGGSIRG